MNTLNFIEVCNLSELRELGRKSITIGKNKVVLFFLNGKVYAINSICPHQGGDLSCGELHDEEVHCPSHSFMFNIKTGACLNYPGYSLKSYKVKVQNDIVKIGVE